MKHLLKVILASGILFLSACSDQEPSASAPLPSSPFKQGDIVEMVLGGKGQIISIYSIGNRFYYDIRLPNGKKDQFRSFEFKSLPEE